MAAARGVGDPSGRAAAYADTGLDGAAAGGAESFGGSSMPSFRMDAEKFVRGNVAVFRTGVVLKDHPKAFTVNPDALEVYDIIGRGASSFVQRAVHKPTGTRLALKVYNLFARDKRSQLTSEIETLYDADCECLVKFFGAFFQHDSITVALEYMDLGSLAHVVERVGPIPEPALAGIAFQMCWGLAYLKHDKRLHRDLKLSNVLINSAGSVKLTDFGMSKELKDSLGALARQTLSVARSFKGTSTHMAPERVLHEAYSFPSDVWSLGVCILESATGVNPYAGYDTYIATCEAILHSPEPSTASMRGFGGAPLSAELDQFVRYCLRKDPAERLPADVLLGAPWLAKHGVVSLPAATEVVRSWVSSLGARTAPAAGAASATMLVDAAAAAASPAPAPAR